ncbi:ATP-dependent helicase [Planococcus maritimus]|uniref:ATP-dependent helicase n=1 Tax=Planococcus maritimus TaxID=192421 RepID=UPI003139E9AF
MNELYRLKLEQIKSDTEQVAAFSSDVSTVVKAGPGSGKTTVLTLKIIRLLNEKINPPRGLACLTFSNEAAKEFTGRIKKLGYQKRHNVFLNTVHSFCISEIITPFAGLYDEGLQFPLDIITNEKKKKLVGSILKDFGIDEREIGITEIDKERNFAIGTNSSVEVERNDRVSKVAKEYEKRLWEENQVDFIEIVKCAATLIEEKPFVRRALEAKFPWILIDEYQDLGKPLHEMILILLEKTNIKIFAVGDPDQSIYGFQGAIPDYLLELYEHPGITSIELKTNYRSNQEIIDASAIALNMDDREYKAGTRQGEEAEFHFVECENEMDDQYHYVVNKIIPHCKKEGISLEEICILVAYGNHVKEMSNKLKEANIPHYLSKHDFAKSRLILWLRDCAKWVLNDTAFSFTELFDYWLTIMDNTEIIPEAKKNIYRRKLYKDLKESNLHSEDLFHWLTFLKSKLNMTDESFPDDYDFLISFIQEAKGGEFNNDLRTFSQFGKPFNQVTLSTRHSSKGLEFEVVIMLGMEQGSFPYYLNVDVPSKLNEERRVFFVCLTRAKRVCYLLYSKRLRNYRKKPSMFLLELQAAIQK